MGDYADDYFDSGMNDWIDSGCPNIRVERNSSATHYYTLHSIEKETDKAFLVRLLNPPHAKNRPNLPWLHAMWLPKSQIYFFDELRNIIHCSQVKLPIDISVSKIKYVVIPKWLFNKAKERK